MRRPLKQNHRVLVSPLIWSMNDGYGRESVLPKTMGALIEAQTHSDSVGCDILFVNNASDHPKTLKDLSEWAETPNCYVHDFEVNHGWGGGRNFAIEMFMKNDYDVLMMMDQDVWVNPEDLYLNKIQEIKDTDPDLHAYMMLVFQEDNQGLGILPTNRRVIICREYLGGVHIIDRKVPEVIGGYNTIDFRRGWGGWQDPLFGRQLKFSGLLDYCGRHYVDPLFAESEHHDAPLFDVETSILREKVVQESGMKFWELQQSMEAGGNTYYPIEYRPAIPLD